MWPQSAKCGRQSRRHPHQPGDVGAEHPRLVLVARLVERRAAERPARVVDEDVEPAELLHRLGDEARAALGLGHVQLERNLGLEPLHPSGSACDMHSEGGESVRQSHARFPTTPP